MLRGAAAPRIAIVGAGIAGLHAAWILKRQGHRATLYESSNRTSGRMFSRTGLLAPGVTTELGGEFIDSNHTEILSLAKTFSLNLLDMFHPEEAALKREAYLFGGALRGEEEILRAFREIAPRLERDIRGGVRRWDRISIAQYLDQAGVSGWLRGVIDVALRTEYGLEIGEQSAMNFLSLISPDTGDGRIKWFGESDERYKIEGGNQRIPDALANELRDQILFEHRLEAISRTPSGAFELTFQKNGTISQSVTADIVLVTTPFTVLRKIALRLDLPPAKRRAIDELGYGTDAKLMLGVKRRLWRDQGYGGNLFSDEPFQLAWDSSRRQAGTEGVVTSLAGGQGGLDYGTGSTEDQVTRLLPGLERAWRGLSGELNGKSARFHWPTHPHTLASYSCYRPGQWRAIRGQEFRPVGRLHFAGEHTSLDAQGYMEGGAETGKRAALAILKRL